MNILEIDPRYKSVVEKLERDSRPIGQMLRSFITPISEDGVVCCLGVGYAEELIHVRTFAGPNATIYAVEKDRRKPNTNGKICAQATNSILLLGADANEVDTIIDTIGRRPELVIFRNPG